jgi:hypothetical protein
MLGRYISGRLYAWSSDGALSLSAGDVMVMVRHLHPKAVRCEVHVAQIRLIIKLLERSSVAVIQTVVDCS